MVRIGCTLTLETVAIVLLLPGVVFAQGVRETGGRTTDRSWGEIAREARVLNEYQKRLSDYVVLRSRNPSLEKGDDRDASWFEAEDGTPSELLCLPDTFPPAPVIGRTLKDRQPGIFDEVATTLEASVPPSHLLFDRELEDVFRGIITRVLRPVDQARVMRVMPQFPTGVPVHIVSEELHAALPAVPDGFEYRFLRYDLLVVDVGANRVVDSIALAIGPTGT